MDTALKNGDFALNSYGKIHSINGLEETIQRCQFLLKVKKGSFCYNRTLGSNLHLLKYDENVRGNALLLVKEALAPLPQVSVKNVDVEYENEVIILKITIKAYSETATMEVIVNEKL